jgi:hypothetical protein
LTNAKYKIIRSQHYNDLALPFALRMSRQATPRQTKSRPTKPGPTKSRQNRLGHTKPRSQRLIVLCVVSFAVLLLLLRLLAFVHGHGRR